MRTKLRLPTNLSESVLNTWPTNWPSSLAGTCSLDLPTCGSASGPSVYFVNAASSSGTPTSFLAAVHRIGTQQPLAIARGNAPSISADDRSPSPRYFSIRASSHSQTASINCVRAAARSTGQSAGAGDGGETTLTTPWNFGPAPSG